MPIGLSPRSTIRIWLDIDIAEEPDETRRPYFTARFMSWEQRIRFNELSREEDLEKDDAKICAMLNEQLDLGITGWGNMGRDISRDEMFDRLLTGQEKYELRRKMMNETALAEADRKKSASAQPSAPAGSAPAATPRDAASIPQLPPLP